MHLCVLWAGKGLNFVARAAGGPIAYARGHLYFLKEYNGAVFLVRYRISDQPQQQQQPQETVLVPQLSNKFQCLARRAERLYFIHNNTIYQTALDGSSLRALGTHPSTSGEDNPQFMFVDSTYLYYTALKSIYRMSILQEQSQRAPVAIYTDSTDKLEGILGYRDNIFVCAGTKIKRLELNGTSPVITVKAFGNLKGIARINNRYIFNSLSILWSQYCALHLILYSCARFVVSDYDTGIVSSLNPEGTDIKLHTAVMRPMGIAVLSDSAANSLSTIPLFISALLFFLSAIVFLQL